MSTSSITTEQPLSTEQLISLELRREITREADSLAEKASELLAKLTGHQTEALAKAQINGLLSVANTAQSTASIVKFLERQGSRREAWQKDRLAETLIQAVKGLLTEATVVAEQVQRRLREGHRRRDPTVDALADKRGRLPEIHYLLAREFIQSFAIGYLYRYSKE
jgi:hypothetical protein